MNFIKPITVTIITIMMLMPQTGLMAAWNAEGRNRIQIAILLDTSSSMDGLIDQAKSQLWKIVNELAMARRNGKTPVLEVALYEYGKSSIPSAEGYMRMITPFTRDLDRISSELFALSTNGGDEYCGMVIDSASRNLQWDTDDSSLKLIFIAGNEPFTQGEVNYLDSVKKAKAKGIIVNTIYCGDRESGITTMWKDGADRSGGRYINIDQNVRVLSIESPQDAEIARLGEELNKTYIAYGQSGKDKKTKQEEQDKNARSYSPGSAVERSISKASAHYENSSWDIVDASKNGTIIPGKLNKDDLPKEMQSMNKSEQEKYIDNMSKKRQELKERINRLNNERRVYIEKMSKKANTSETLDSAVIKIIREQATEKKFEFKS